MPIWAFILAGVASFYDAPGAKMADGEPFIATAHTCAMRYEPFGERVEIINNETGAMSWCIVTDRGPWPPGRVIDGTPAVAAELGILESGIANVRVYRVTGYAPKCHRDAPPQACKAPPPHLCVLDLPKPILLRCL